MASSNILAEACPGVSNMTVSIVDSSDAFVRPDDTVLWSATSSQPRDLVSISPSLPLPSGFREVHPLVTPLPRDRRLAAAVTWSGPDQVLGFTPDALPDDGRVLTDAGVMSRGDFAEKAKDRC
jgi:hypothetical protein